MKSIFNLINISDIFLISILLCAVYSDLQKGKIYNNLLFPAIIFAFLINIFEKKFLAGFFFGFKGFSLGLILLIIPYAIGAVGAGDVKLLAFIGSVKGTLFVFVAAIATFIIGGLISLIILFLSKKPLENLSSFRLALVNVLNALTGLDILKVKSENLRFQKMRYSLAILMGSIVALFLL
jgi:prepilin peptidase CpaA